MRSIKNILSLASLLLLGCSAFVPPQVSLRKKYRQSYQVARSPSIRSSSSLAVHYSPQEEEESRSSPHNAPTSKKAAPTFLLSILLSLALVFSPTAPAQAGFGAPGGATTSPIPGLTQPRIQEQDLDGKKLKQLIDSSIDGRRLEDFSTQLDQVIVALKERKDMDINQAQSFEFDEQELLKAQGLQEQIQNREEMLHKLEAQPYWFNYLAAFVGSVSSTLVMHPVDTIKTRLQLRSFKEDDGEEEEPFEVIMDHSSISSTTNTRAAELQQRRSTRNDSAPLVLEGGEQPELVMEPSLATQTHVLERPTDMQEEGHESLVVPIHSPIHSNTHASDKFAKEEEEEGLFDSLYEGLTGNILKEGPPSALYLGVYESVKYSLVPITSPEYLLLVYLLAGAAGETVGSVVRAPAEALKSLVQSKSADSALDAAKSILANPDEQTNVLRAWSASIWRDVPFGAIQLAIFELIKASILNNPNIEFDSSTLQAEAIIGAFAGGIGALLTNPADVVTTRIITQSTNDDDNDPLGVLGMAKKVHEEGGPAAFFSGWQARVGYWAPSISIFLTCYCSVRQAGIQYDFF